eukprot:TRINITY_DN4696_c0_g1_i4.p1 TRINITY_DN4696_c0_g1~~TRINITY_DN4696_c0_g1_i4.p1  ORF type:complete len:104 (+),score=12.52 TRINITY_DN4696_c0_g1_i4:373-684(+)
MIGCQRVSFFLSPPGYMIDLSKLGQEGNRPYPQHLQVLQWLQANNLSNQEIVDVFYREKITMDNMKYLKDLDLQRFGISQWETRVAILNATQKYSLLINQFLN